MPWTDTPLALATAYRDAFFAGEELTANEPEPGEIGSGIPAVAFAYSGVLQGTQVDGAMFVGADRADRHRVQRLRRQRHRSAASPTTSTRSSATVQVAGGQG